MSEFLGSKMCIQSGEQRCPQWSTLGLVVEEKEHGRCYSETLFQNVLLSAETRNIEISFLKVFYLFFFLSMHIDLSCGEEFPRLNNTVWRDISFCQSYICHLQDSLASSCIGSYM